MGDVVTRHCSMMTFSLWVIHVEFPKFSPEFNLGIMFVLKTCQSSGKGAGMEGGVKVHNSFLEANFEQTTYSSNSGTINTTSPEL